MKKLLITSLCAIAIFTTSFAQTFKERIEIKGGNSAYENFMKQVYLYPAFKDGTIKYKDGREYKKQMNYNRLAGTIEYIEKADTVMIPDEQNVNIVIVGVDVFLFNPECLQIIPTTGKVKLLKHVAIKVSDTQKIGAFGTRSVVGSIETYKSHETWRDTYQFDTNEIIILTKTTNFNIASDNVEITPATKKTVLKIYSKRQEEVKKFIDDHKTNFNRENDLVELMAYLSQLDNG